MARDRRRLGADDEALWSAVKRTVEPLRPADREPPPPAMPAATEAVPQAPRGVAAVLPKPVPPSRPAMPGLHPLGRRERQRVVRGKTEIDGRIDLHGLTQDEAHARLAGFLSRAQAEGRRVVLVITGKGGGGGFGGLHGAERGVLRRVVPIWLSLPEFRRLVLGFEDAHLAHGGSGALYVRIRRRKS
ncbi:MAG TPA: Smr/MutS family protein [Methylomirabilota bacterium]|nr:Smr/MutS family protein [Methylomirabilota bacterium]